jgi:photosystem II stability/assembly factor-like uncharacterized protein
MTGDKAIDHGNTGLYKSSDSGQTWTNLTIPITSAFVNEYLTQVGTSANGSFVLVVSADSSVPFFSNDGGVIWYSTNYTYFQFHPQTIAVSGDGTRLLAAGNLVTNNYENGN